MRSKLLFMHSARLTRVDQNGNGEEIRIDQVTHIGRGVIQPYSTKVRPEDLRDARVGISLKDELGTVSQNHALIYPGPKFQIFDLESTNGTWIITDVARKQCVRISPRLRVELKTGDIIAFSQKVWFKFEQLENAFNQPGLNLPGSGHNRALMVGHEGPRIFGQFGLLHGTTDDVEDLKKELEKRGFAGNITALTNGAATKENVLRSLDDAARLLTTDSTFIFYFSGHGTPKGELILGRETLEKNELLEKLRNLRGKILLILDGCYTEAFAGEDDHFVQHAALIGHESVAREAGTVVHGAENNIRGVTTRAIVKVLRAYEGSMDVANLIRVVNEFPKVQALNKQVAYRANTILQIPSRVR